MNLGPARYQKIKSFSGSFREGFTTEISIDFLGTHKDGDFTVKVEDGTVVILLGRDHNVTGLYSSKRKSR